MGRERLDEAARVRIVQVAGAAYAGLVVLVTWQALRGQPLLSPDGSTLTAAGLIAAGVLIGGGLAFRQPARDRVAA